MARAVRHRNRVPQPLLTLALCLAFAALPDLACVEVFPENEADTSDELDSDAVGDPTDRGPSDTEDGSAVLTPDTPDPDSPTVDLPDATPDAESDPNPTPDADADDTSDVACPNDCALPPNDCYTGPGTCEGGECVFAFRGMGVECNDDNTCTEADACNEAGECVGVAVECEYPHTLGSFCTDGECQGWTCAEGWGDCNDDLALDGCETPLDTLTNCGECDVPCANRAHSTASCSTLECVRTCTNPYENCDEDWANGCEIPTGIPNQCDVNGLNPTTGCWTAHCGTLADADARNFGTWYCYECTTCHIPAAGRCQWCSHSVGVWFPDDACACGSSEDLVCSP